MIRSTVFVFSTAFVLTLAATAMAQPLAPDMASTDSAVRRSDLADAPTLRNLDAELHGTGRVAVPDVGVEGNGILGAASIAERPETRVRSFLVSPTKKALTRISLRDDPLLDFQYGNAFAISLEACRFDLARQLGVTPAEIAAGIVTLRWTVEPSGRVRDVSVVAWSPTDEAVTACANLVVVRRVLPNPVERPVALEWTYAFRKIPAITETVPVQEAVPNGR